MFTTRGATAGLILIEWNMQADNPGSAGLVCIKNIAPHGSGSWVFEG